MGDGGPAVAALPLVLARRLPGVEGWVRLGWEIGLVLPGLPRIFLGRK